MSEQAPGAAQDGPKSACPHPEAVGKRWGDPISEQRQAELQGYLDRWQAETDHGERKGPFAVVRLTGADARWVADRVRDWLGSVGNLHLEEADLSSAHLEGADLSSAHLQEADLFQARLDGADLRWAHLEGANLNQAHLEAANLRWAHLEGTGLFYAHLEGADLREAHLAGADFGGAHLAGAKLAEAHLEGTNLFGAHLQGADLRRAGLDKTTRLNEATLTGVYLDQVVLDNTNLTVVDWDLVSKLGDELVASQPKDEAGEAKTRAVRVDDYKGAVRANRLLAVALQGQGLTDEEDYFAYRAKLLQQRLRRLQGRWSAWLFSWLLGALAGYGYRLGRIARAYFVLLLVYAAAYYAAGAWLGGKQLAWYEALLVSLTAIHGRVFFTQFGLDSLQAWVAAVESVTGIVIEGTFVAMLIQRFFGR
jgi:uncharacterized protein YjbI with pentapeptide repeats